MHMESVRSSVILRFGPCSLRGARTITISKELLDELLKGRERPECLLGDAGLMKELKIKLMERMPGAELIAHLGYEDGTDAPPGQSNRRNGTSTKMLKGQEGEMPVAVPRDRASSFEPALVLSKTACLFPAARA